MLYQLTGIVSSYHSGDKPATAKARMNSKTDASLLWGNKNNSNNNNSNNNNNNNNNNINDNNDNNSSNNNNNNNNNHKNNNSKKPCDRVTLLSMEGIIRLGIL
ncbi:hypothetical protein PoB_006632200 [Plakobranchus ocellatus]|uniref:Uncharacterized protein n=1 Tax=Plakobranchus ocellatus TaxID=259542 RepID=A0AAV4D6T0_9GAST|nr:hypothetical protein PoB_006632200 [Plakobranchus ocellatus]